MQDQLTKEEQAYFKKIEDEINGLRIFIDYGDEDQRKFSYNEAIDDCLAAIKELRERINNENEEEK